MNDTFKEDTAAETTTRDKTEPGESISSSVQSSQSGLDSTSLLEQAASNLQDIHRLSSGPPKPVPAWQAIDETEHWLNKARKACVTAPSEAGKAAEWLLDNDYQVYRAIRQIKEDLPENFYRRLPALKVDDQTAYPRVFTLAHDLLQANRLQITLAGTVQFICAYQRSNSLTIGELWAFPTMLRIACLEILVSSLTAVLQDQVEKPFEPTPSATAPYSLDDTERVARSIANLSLIASISWEDFFDRTSEVERILSSDPSGFYPQMDFETRDRYRRAVEVLSGYSEKDEPGIAAEVLKLAALANAGDADHHVGHWLIGDGRQRLEEFIDASPPLGLRLRRTAFRHAGPLYAGALATIWLGALIFPAIYLFNIDSSAREIIGSFLVMLIPASILATSLVQRLATIAVPPKILPKLDFTDGLPNDCPTIVVIPVLVAKAAEIAGLIEQMETHWLSNSDKNLQVAMLADLADAKTEHTDSDEEIINALIGRVRDLNTKHAKKRQGCFHLLLRARIFNECEGCWMAWERKRGKLERFNQLLVEGDDSGFSIYEGHRPALDHLRFVITVDADTILPTGSVLRLVGTLAHPQNQARFDPQTGQIVSGYSILQPRVEMAPQSVSRTFFTRFFAGDTAIDIYSHAVSNVYQDLFGTGIFVGKGIYDVAAFHRTVDGRVPENQVLSHDLLEGALGRAGLASDIVLYEGFPGNYLEYVKRWHRWVRGDWQLLPWLGRFAPGRDGQKIRNRLAGLDIWKIIDNLRRSLVPPSLLLMVTIGWLFLPGNPWFWTLLTVFAHAGQLFTDLVTGLAQGRRRGAVRGLFAQLADQSGRWFLAIAYLPFEAFVTVHAILVSLWRQYISRRNMLQWTSAAHETLRQAKRNSRPSIWFQMWSGPVTTVLLGMAIFWVSPASLPAAAPLLLVWFIAPEITTRLNRPRHKSAPQLDESDRLFLREIARRTWFYFETFAGPQDNWLPPDNYQGEPHPETAHRTSPTNIGMMILSTASAWDLGYLGAEELAARTSNSYATLDRLETYRGHFLNWYDTLSLQPLEPRYVSVVDSGNLAGALVAWISLLREVEQAPVVGSQRWAGIADVLRLLSSVVKKTENIMPELVFHIARMDKELSEMETQPLKWRGYFEKVCQNDISELEKMIGAAVAIPDSISTPDLREMHNWLDRLRHQLQSVRHDIEKFAPWLKLNNPPPDLASVVQEVIESLNQGMDEPRLEQALARLQGVKPTDKPSQSWLNSFIKAIESGRKRHRALAIKLRNLSRRTARYIEKMEFAPFYNPDRRLFHIGYNASADKLDQHHYDLLASEARLASYFAIASKQVPVEHWFHLGRPVMRSGRGLALISWNGSMFEYLMPRLLMRSGPETLLNESEKVAVEMQQAYGDKTGTPWGISESAYAARDPDHRYQYQAFGVPGLGLRRGLAKDMVVAPYASALALQVLPVDAVHNMRKMVELGFSGLYGLFEAADFTEERTETGKTVNLVHAYMAHHQGMVICAIGNSLFDDILVRRFENDPRMRAVSLLLNERVPQELPSEVERIESIDLAVRTAGTGTAPHKWFPALATNSPQSKFLGNGSLSSSISTGGGGGMKWRHYALTRFVPDATLDADGLWIYLHDDETGNIWSATRQPTDSHPDRYEVEFHSHMAEFHRHDQDISVRTEICVAAGDDLEIRRLSLANLGDRPRALRVTSYAEPVLAPALEDERHPAFSKLFVGSEYIPRIGGLLFTRRARNPKDTPPVLLHFTVCDDGSPSLPGYQTDRRKFIGRNGSLHRPPGCQDDLDGSTGWTLDPIMALQHKFELKAFEHQEICFVTIAAATREAALEVAERYATLASLDWAINDAASAAVHETKRLEIAPDDIADIETLGSLLLYPHSKLGVDIQRFRENKLGQSSLWGMAISGDYPILLHKAAQNSDSLLSLLIRAHQLWRRQGLEVDLVIMQSAASGYIEPVRDDLMDMLQDIGAQWMLGRNGGVHLVFVDQIGADQARLLEAVARVVVDDRLGPLNEQLDKALRLPPTLPRFEPARPVDDDEDIPQLTRPDDLLFDNGLGGFSADGREYVIHLEPQDRTPAPWVNILANDVFGSVLTEAGGGFSWAVNSGENRISPWTNDAVTDEPSETLYLRDEETAQIWNPTPGPNGREAACQIRHGAGYTDWRKISHGLEQDLRIFVPTDDPVKIIRLRLTNRTTRHRRITATYYVNWLLGSLPSVARPSVNCFYDSDHHAIFAKNVWNPDFAERAAFLTANRLPHGLTTDRKEFFGREGSLDYPSGLQRWGLEGPSAAGTDPCAAYQVHLELDPGQSEEVIFILGQGADKTHANSLVADWKNLEKVEAEFKKLGAYWDDLLGQIEVRTPDPAFNIMVNRWLLYQSMSSRLLARAGFYQASGAIGFRDQLQDVMAFLHNDPARARAHILACAAHQFEQGDVLHWWHPPTDRGVRTRCSDDLLWLPYVVCEYVRTTGDESILQEKIPYLRAPPLSPEEEDRYSDFESTSAGQSLKDHCESALERGITHGRHGLPLIGAGDWNDGMDRIGDQGRGESVWLAWFAIVTANAFSALCSRIGDERMADNWSRRAKDLLRDAEESGWDGSWYKRAFDDDGHPWGSLTNIECRIDSISQSWALFAGADSERTRTALDSAYRELVDEKNQIARLLWPPFDKSPRDPGYIKAYPPGIRENGGQYSHATAWLGIALARAGEADKAMHVFKMLNPVERALDRKQAERYRVEPYAVAADIGGGDIHGGRGGWTWYTGAAAWTWRLGMEEILGLKQQGGSLLINPVLPGNWSDYTATIRRRNGSIHLTVEQNADQLAQTAELTVDGVVQTEMAIDFPQDGSERKAVLRLNR